MKKFLLFVTVTAVFNSFAQAPQVEWQKVLGGTSEDKGYQVIETVDNGFLISGTTTSGNGDITGYKGGRDIWIIKLNTTGIVQWNKTYGGTNHEDAIVKQTSDGGYIIAGSTNSNDGDVTNLHGQKDFWVVKTDAAGEILWQKTYGGSGEDALSRILIDTNGGYMLFGSTSSFDGDVTGGHGMRDLWMVKIDNEGTIMWQKALGGSANETPTDILQSTDNEYVLYAQTYSGNGDVASSSGSPKLWVVKVNTLGEIVWQKIIGGIGLQEPVYISQTEDGGYIVSSITNYNSGVDYPLDVLITKLNSQGTTQWQTTFGGSDYELGIIKQTNDGGYILSGYTYSSNGDIEESNGMAEILIVKLNDSGIKEWAKTYGGSNWDFFSAAPGNSYYFPPANIIEMDNGYVITGITESSNSGDVIGGNGPGNSDVWTFKINLSGILQWQKVLGGSADDTAHDIIKTLDGGYIFIGSTRSNDGDILGHHGNIDIYAVKFGPETLSSGNFTTQQISVYPNPATTQLNIVLPNNTVTETVSVIDVTGKEVLRQSGHLILNVENLESGIYFIEVATQEALYRSKFIKE